MDRIEIAKALAAKAHAGQVDKAGRPYIEHPIVVSSMLEGEDEKITALLHDVVEDTDVSLDEIRRLFGDTIADAVGCMTHDKSVDYFTYIKKIKNNPIARKVKLADLTHNMDLSRLPEVGESDLKRLEKYKKARMILLENEK